MNVNSNAHYRLSRGRLSLPIALCVAFFVAAAGCAGCSDDTPSVKDDEDTGVEDAGLDSGGGSDASGSDTAVTDTGGGDSGVLDTGNELDTGSGSSSGADAGKIPPCSSNAFCLTALAKELKPCEEAYCEVSAGVCKKRLKPGKCCNDGDCNDNNPNTKEKCDLSDNTCQYESVSGVCASGKKVVVFSDEGFEQGGNPLPPSWKQTNSFAKGNVKWHVSTNRSHSGKHSLYLGNECKTYNTSSNEGNKCTGQDGKAFKATLASVEANIPAQTQAIAHFWLWIDAEPLWTQTDDQKKNKFDPSNGCKPAKCAEQSKGSKNPCCFAQTCVKLPGGNNTCLNERDVLKLFVQVKGETHAVWDSSLIGKTTQGKWVHQLVDLTPYCKGTTGCATKLFWEFSTETGALNDYEGVYLDDFKVETLCVGNQGYGKCDPQTSCKASSNACAANACTLSLNQKNLGLCFYDKTPGCCTGVLDCDDKQSCTIDSCNKPDKKKPGNCVHKPDSSNPQCCQPKSVFSEDFASGSTGAWTFSSCNSKSVKWHATKNQAKSGSHSMCFSNTNGKGYHDASIAPKGPACTVCSKPIKLTAGTVYNTLEFAVKMQTEWSGQPKEKYKNPPKPGLNELDKLVVFVKDAGKEVTIWSSDQIQGTTGNKGADWQSQFSAGLDKFAGKTKEICFKFDAGDNSGNDQGHICVDDIKVGVACKQDECKSASDCNKGGTCDEATCEKEGDALKCKYTKKQNCCVTEKDCDDKNSCTKDTCASGKCINAVDPKDKDCCAPMTTKLGNQVGKHDFEGGKTPAGWVLKPKTGQPPFGGGASYSKTFTWSVSALKSKPGTGNYSLYFGKNGTFNAGTDVAAGTAESPEITLQASSKSFSIVTFDLFLDTEWTKNAWKKYPFPIDQLKVLAKDVDDAKAKWLPVWDSYDIEGSTHGKWTSIVALIPQSLNGKKITLRFDFDAGNKNFNNFEGAYVDNLTVETVCTKPACTSVKDCTKSDTCKRYFCGKDPKTEAPVCYDQFKPGKGCCQPTLLLPLETVEGGGFDQWEVPTAPQGDVKWHVVKKGTAAIPTYLNGQHEIRFGSTSKPHYLTGSGKSCTDDNGCKGAEKCAKNKSGTKGCYLPVKGTLRSKPIKPPTDAKAGLEFRFKAYIDVEKTFETMQIVAVNQTATSTLKVLWTKAKNLKATDYKKVVDVKVDLQDMITAGAIFRLEIRFDSTDAKQNDKYLGIHVDDLRVEQTCK